jgi:hypothetical protein
MLLPPSEGRGREVRHNLSARISLALTWHSPEGISRRALRISAHSRVARVAQDRATVS